MAITLIAKYKHFILFHKDPMVYFVATLVISQLPTVTRSRCLDKKKKNRYSKFSHHFCLKLRYVYKLVENVSLLPLSSVMGTETEVWSSSTARCCLVLLGGPIIHPQGRFSVWLKVIHCLPVSNVPNTWKISLAQVFKADRSSDKRN